MAGKGEAPLGRQHKKLKLSLKKKNIPQHGVAVKERPPSCVKEEEETKKEGLSLPSRLVSMATDEDENKVQSCALPQKRRQEGEESEEEEEENEFKISNMNMRQLRKRKIKNKDPLNTIEHDQLQLALALSASEMPQVPPAHAPKRPHGAKSGRRRKVGVATTPPLLAISSPMKKQIIASRLEEMLDCQEEDIPCTPALAASTIGVGVVPVGGANDGTIAKTSDSVHNMEIKDINCNVSSHPSPVAVPDDVTNVPDDVTSVLNDVTSVPDDGTSVPDDVTSVPDDVTSVPSSAPVAVPSVSSPVPPNHSLLHYSPPSDRCGGYNEFSNYKTLWVLTAAGPEDSLSQFYVPALRDFIPQPRVDSTRCRICHSEPCLATLIPFTLIEEEAEEEVERRVREEEDKTTVKTQDAPAQSSSADLISPAERLQKDLSSLLDTSLYSDVLIKVSNERSISGHAAVLAARCPAMARVLSGLSSDNLCLDLSLFTFDAVKVFLRFLYTATLPVNTDSTTTTGPLTDDVKRQLLTLAEIWEVPGLLRLLSEKTTPTPINNSSSSSSPSLLPVTPQHVPPLPSSLEEERGGSPFCPTSQVEDKGCSPTSLDPVPSPPLSPLLFSGVSPVEKEINFDASHDYHVTSPTPPAPVPIKGPSSPHHLSVATGDTPSGCGKRVEFITPHGVARGGALLQSDDNITPMPDYKNMATPHLKNVCSQFGVRVLPKRKMIKLLEQIYTYSHPLVDENGDIVEEGGKGEERGKRRGRGGRGGGKEEGLGGEESQPAAKGKKRKEQNKEEQERSVMEGIINDTELYQDVLQYKPMELSFIHNRLKSNGVGMSKERLMDVLDQLCVTYTIPRQRIQQE